jgi:hypothetical protein
LEAAKSNLGSIIQDIVLQHSVKQSEKVPSESVLYQFDKFLGSFEKKKENPLLKTLDENLFRPQFKEFIRKVTLPRNVVLDYKSDKEKEEFLRKDRNKIQTLLSHNKSEKMREIIIKPKKMTHDDKLDILHKYLKKEDIKNRLMHSNVLK